MSDSPQACHCTGLDGAVNGPEWTPWPVPGSHVDLLERPICGVLTTMGRDGQPHSSLVWVDYDGAYPRVNTTLERVSLLVADPENTTRFIEIRGDAELVVDGATEHLDALTRQYTGHARFYGFAYPRGQQSKETRVICVIHPRRIVLDAIHVQS